MAGPLVAAGLRVSRWRWGGVVGLTLPPVFLGCAVGADHSGRTTVRLMLERVDLADVHEVERARRSVVMLSPGQWALKREDAMRLFAALLAQLEQAEAGT